MSVAFADSSVAESCDDKATIMIGMSSKLPVITRGSTLDGRVVPRLSIALRMSAAMSSGSIPNSHWTLTWETPLELFEVTVVTPAIALTADSIGLDTSVSTTCGLAPGYTVRTLPRGRSNAGISSCLSAPAV